MAYREPQDEHSQRFAAALGDRVAQWRANRGLSMSETARMVGGMDARGISLIEKGRVMPSWQIIRRISAATGMTFFIEVDKDGLRLT